MVQLAFLVGFIASFGICIYMFIPKSTDMPGEAILGEKAQLALKEFFMKPLNWIAYQMDTKDKKCLEVLGESKTKFAIQRVGFMVGFAVLAYIAFGAFPVVIGLLLGWIFPSLLLRSKYNNWKDEVVADIPTMVDYLVVYFSVGYNVKRALVDVADAVGPALSREIQRLNADIEISKNYSAALDRMSERIDDYHADNVIQRLKSSWEMQVSADTFANVSESLLEMRKLKVSIETSRYKIFMVVLPILGVIGMLIMVGVPLAYWVMGQFTEISFTSN